MTFEKQDSKTHSGVISYFHQHYIKTGRIEIDLGQAFAHAEKIRIHSDYNDFFIVSRQQAQVQLEMSVMNRSQISQSMSFSNSSKGCAYLGTQLMRERNHGEYAECSFQPGSFENSLTGTSRHFFRAMRGYPDECI